MGRNKTVDGTETGTVTIRLPLWVMEYIDRTVEGSVLTRTELYRDIVTQWVRGRSER
jgi:hypothetical protein